jgi:hypothetical protein
MRARPPQHHLNQRPSFAQHSCEQLCLSIPLRTTSRPPLRPIASRVLEQAHHPCDLTRLLAAEAGAFGPNQTVCRLPAAGWAPGRRLRSYILVFATVVVIIPFLPSASWPKARALTSVLSTLLLSVRSSIHHPCVHTRPSMCRTLSGWSSRLLG